MSNDKIRAAAEQAPKPCPLCGGHAVVDGRSDDVRVRCESCGTTGPVKFWTSDDDDEIEEAERDAIKAWNTRALAEQPQPDYPCRSDGRCQYAIDSGAEGMGHCPRGKCVMPAAPAEQPQPEPSDLAHELWALAQCAPGEGIEDAVARIDARLTQPEATPMEATRFGTMEPTFRMDAQDAARYRWLREHAKEELVRPETLDSEFPDMRTHWVLPALIAYGPVGGPTRTLDEAIDAALAAREGR